LTELTPEAVHAALVQSKGNVTEAARILGVTRVTVYKWMKRYNIDRRVIIESPAA